MQDGIMGRAIRGAALAAIVMSAGAWRERTLAQPAAAVAESPPVAGDRWQKELDAFATRDRARPPATGGVCLVGSSNIRLWDTLATDFPGMNVVGRGVGGCRLSELVDFAPQLVERVKPRVIVVSAGTNDVNAGATAAEVREAFARLVVTLRRGMPDVTIAFLAIAPSIKRWDQIDRQREANDAVQAFIDAAADPRLRYLDACAAFLGPDGRPDRACFVDDLLHPSAEGNARRAAVLRPALAALLAEAAAK